MENNIYKILTKKNMTQAELAFRVGIGLNNLNRIINNRASTYLENGIKICRELEKPFEEVFILKK